MQSASQLTSAVASSRAEIKNQGGTLEAGQLEADMNFEITSDELTQALSNLSETEQSSQNNIDAAQSDVDAANDAKTQGEAQINEQNAQMDENVANAVDAVNGAVGEKQKKMDALTKAVNNTKYAEKNVVKSQIFVENIEKSLSGAKSDLQYSESAYNNFNVDQFAAQTMEQTGCSEGEALEKAKVAKDMLKGDFEEKRAQVNQLEQDLQKAKTELAENEKALGDAVTAQDKCAEDLDIDKDLVIKAYENLKFAKVSRDQAKKEGISQLEQLEKKRIDSENNLGFMYAASEKAKDDANKLVDDVNKKVDMAQNQVDKAQQESSSFEQEASAVEALNQAIEGELVPALNSRGQRALSLYGTLSSNAGKAQETQADSTDKSKKTKYAALNGETFEDTCRRLGIKDDDMKKIIEVNTGKGLALGTKQGNNPKYFMAGREITIPNELKNSINKDQLMNDSDIEKQGKDWKTIDDFLSKANNENNKKAAINKFHDWINITRSDNNKNYKLTGKKENGEVRTLKINSGNVTLEDSKASQVASKDSANNQSVQGKKDLGNVKSNMARKPAGIKSQQDKEESFNKVQNNAGKIFDSMEKQQDIMQKQIQKVFEDFKKEKPEGTKEEFKTFLKDKMPKADDTIISVIAAQIYK